MAVSLRTALRLARFPSDRPAFSRAALGAHGAHGALSSLAALALLGIVLGPPLTARAADSLAVPPNENPARLTLTTGLDGETLREAFGFASLFGTSGETDGSVVLEGTRYRDEQTNLRALLGIDGELPAGRPWRATGSLEARLGGARRSMSFSGEVARDSAALRGLRMRHLLYLDDRRDDDEAGAAGFLSGQSLAQLQWKPGGAGPGRDLVLRGAADISWAREGGVEGDSALATYAGYLDYQRYSVGAGLVTGGLAGATLWCDLTRKQAPAASPTAYWAAMLAWTRSRWSLRGMLDLDARLELRRYDGARESDSLSALTSALPSYGEAEAAARFAQEIGFAELAAELRATADIYENAPAAVTPDSLLPIGGDALDADRLRVESRALLKRELLGGFALPSEALARGVPTGTWLRGLTLGAGTATDLVWVAGGDSDWRSAGLRVEAQARGGPGLGEGWLEIAVEAGRRIYPGEADELVFDVGEATFSLSQTDFTYWEISAIGGGRLPLGMEWELSAFFDREEHDLAADDIELFSVRLGVLRRWDLIR